MSLKFIGSLLAVLVLAGVHLFFPRLDLAAHGHRGWLMPFSGGVAIGYVFLLLLPKIGDYTAAIIRAEVGGWEFFHYRLYLFALVGMVGYYIVDHYGARKTANDAQVVFVHGLGFSAYSFTVGYLFTAVPREGFFPFGLAAVVFGLHLFGVNHQHRQ